MALVVAIRSAHSRSRRSYGSPRVHEELKAQGIRVGRKRVARLMRERGIRSKAIRRAFRVTTTDSAHHYPIAPNLLERRFSPLEIEGLNSVWAADITYIPTGQGWLYLAVVIDLASRRVLGWSMQQTLQRSLAVDALKMAVLFRRPGTGMIHHSDRGTQYASADYRELLQAHSIECSMSRRGDCWDNAVIESFFATLKKELVRGTQWKTRSEARAAIFEYIEVWYNRQRRHSSIGYLSPAEYEETFLRTAA